MGKFVIGFSEFATLTSPKTAAKIIGASAKAFECVEINMFGGGQTAAADTQHEAQVGFLSNGGTGTVGSSPTPEPMEQGSNASDLTAGVNYSAEPTTYGTVIPLFTFNQRGGMRWAVPRTEGFKTNGAATNLSFGTRVDSQVAGVVSGNLMWWE